MCSIGNAKHGCESLGTDIQSIREIDDSGCTLISEIDTMMTNMLGSSILKSTGHTSQVKPVNLSVRFILEMENKTVMIILIQSQKLWRMILKMIGSHV